jgi:hypothetical protein
MSILVEAHFINDKIFSLKRCLKMDILMGREV